MGLIPVICRICKRRMLASDKTVNEKTGEGINGRVLENSRKQCKKARSGSQ